MNVAQLTTTEILMEGDAVTEVTETVIVEAIVLMTKAVVEFVKTVVIAPLAACHEETRVICNDMSRIWTADNGLATTWLS